MQLGRPRKQLLDNLCTPLRSRRFTHQSEPGGLVKVARAVESAERPQPRLAPELIAMRERGAKQLSSDTKTAQPIADDEPALNLNPAVGGLFD